MTENSRPPAEGPTPRRSTHRTRALLVLAFAVAGFGVATAPAPASTPPPASPVTQAEAVARPGVVYVQAQWKGWIRIPRNNQGVQPGLVGPYEGTSVCSGFVAKPDGHIVTAGHCVDDESMLYGGKNVILQALGRQVLRDDVVTEAQLPDLLETVVTLGKVEGFESGSPPERTLSVYQTVAASGVVMTQPLQPTVVEFVPLEDGDVALLKVESSSPMPALEVAPESVESGTEVIAGGYPGSVANSVDPQLLPSFKDGTTSSTQTIGGVPFTEISAATTPGMSGGPVVDLDGRVIGTVSWGPPGETQAFNFISGTGPLRAMLARNGITGPLSEADAAYRTGLDSYFAGNYEAAVESFDEVLDTVPNHAQAQSYRSKALAAVPDEGEGAATDEGGSVLPWILAGLAAAVLLAAAVVGAVLLSRRRGRGAAPATPPVPAQRTESPDVATPVAAPVAEAPPAGEVTSRAGRFCPNCGAPHAAEAHFCAECGQPFAPVAAVGDGEPGGGVIGTGAPSGATETPKPDDR